VEQEYCLGIVVVDANRLVVLCYAGRDKEAYRVCMFTWKDSKLTLTW
jgi:hypothetical protein